MLQRLNKRDRIPYRDYNELVDGHNSRYEMEAEIYRNAPTVEPVSNLWGVCAETVPVFSLLEISSTASGIASNEAPVVTVQKPSSDTPVALFTNAEVSGTKVNLIPLQVGKPFKLDCVTTDTFVLGEECGPLSGSFQVTSTGTGLICLSDPVTYQGTRKYIWACARLGGAGGVEFFHAQLTTDWGAGPPASASGDLYSMEMTDLAMNVSIIDRLGAFAILHTGDWLEIKKIRGIYYTNQGPCPV